MGLGRDRECAGRHGENGGARRRNRRTRAPTQTALRTLERRRASAACPENRRSDRLGSPSSAWSGSEIGRRRRCIATARSVEWRRQASVASAEKAAFGSHTVARVGSARGAVRRFRSSNHRHGARSRAKQRAARPPVDPGNPSNPSNPSLDIRRTPLFAPLPMSIDALASRSDGLQRKPDTSIDAARTLRRRVRTDHPLRAVHRVPRSNRSVSAAHCRRNGVRMAAEPIKIDPSRSVGIRSRRRARPSVRYARRRARRADFRRAAPASARRGTDAGAPAARFGIPTRAPAAYHSRIAHPQGHRRAPPPTNGQARPPARRSTQES